MTTTETNGTTTHAPSAALVKQETRAIEPQDMAELVTYADAAAKSGFYGAKNREQALMIAMTGRDLGLSYSQALRAFHVIEVKDRPPKLALSADGMVAVCLSHPSVCEYFRIVESDDAHAVVEAKRVGSPARQASFTLEEAKRAGLVKDFGNWKSWPARMCLARAKSFLARDLFPDLLMGLYDPDELRDGDAVSAPRQVRAEVVVEVSAAARAFETAIGAAATPAEMKQVSQSIADANLGEVDVAHLKAIYQARVAELKKAGAK